MKALPHCGETTEIAGRETDARMTVRKHTPNVPEEGYRHHNNSKVPEMCQGKDADARVATTTAAAIATTWPTSASQCYFFIYISLTDRAPESGGSMRPELFYVLFLVVTPVPTPVCRKPSKNILQSAK